MWELKRYEEGMKGEWDAFVRDSRNGTFLFLRDYMDYHRDRFADSSMLAFKNGKLRALLPADVVMGECGFTAVDEEPEVILRSHGGLTYGGWITSKMHFDATDMLDLFDVWIPWCRENCIDVVDYRPVPWIYTAIPAQEDTYALYRHGFGVERLNISSTVDLRNPRPFNKLQKRHLKEGEQSGASIEELTDLAEFHLMLTCCLAERHGASPVHSLAELELLKSRFPENIRFYGVRASGELVAGVCIFDTGRVAHCQYIASTASGRDKNLLTLLFSHLLTRVYGGENPEIAGRRYFDFGTSNEDGSKVLNSGLLGQKASLGGSGVAYPAWILKIPS